VWSFSHGKRCNLFSRKALICSAAHFSLHYPFENIEKVNWFVSERELFKAIFFKKIIKIANEFVAAHW